MHSGYTYIAEYQSHTKFFCLLGLEFIILMVNIIKWLGRQDADCACSP